MRRAVLGAAALGVAVLVLAAAGGAANLPGGTPITVSITSPADGATVGEVPFPVSGQASVGQGAAVANTTVIYVVDVSGSTQDTLPLSSCPNQNVYDTIADTTLDCELLAVRNTNNAAISAGTVKQIGMVGFAQTAAALDLDPGTGLTKLVAPNANTFTPVTGMSTVITPADNLDWVTQSAFLDTFTVPPLIGWPVKTGGATDGFTLFTSQPVGAGTDYGAALQAIQTLVPSITTPQTLVVMLSDGVANQTSGTVSAILGNLQSTAASAHTKLTIDTFAVGSLGTNGATCGTNPPANTSFGSLQQLATLTGGTCTLTNSPGAATSLVPAAIASQLTNISLTVDGNPVPVSASLPATGPATVSWTAGVGPLTAGDHQLCPKATGTDAAGSGDTGVPPANCITVHVQAPPTITLGGANGSAGTTDEGTPLPISATVTGGPVTSLWSSSGGTGTCTFDDPTALNTNVTCTDDGPYTLTLTVDDHKNPAVTQSETLTVNNVAPTATLTISPTVVPLSAATVHASAPITDPGADTWTCVINWGDGSTDTFTTAVRSCDADHTYTAAGPFPVHLQVTDDDHGTGGADAGANVQGAPTITGLPQDNGNTPAGEVFEGSPFQVSGVSTDEPATFAWSAGGGTGNCTFAPATDANPTITCDDNGLYLITVTATDQYGQPSHGSFHLLVDNVKPAPTLTLSSTSVGLNNAAITASVPFTDPGNDQWTCMINWGDGSTDTYPSAGHSCDHGHTYTTAGHFPVVVTVTDDDHGSGTATSAIDVKAPPAFPGLPGDGSDGFVGTVNEGSPFHIGGTAVGATSIVWTAGGGTGHCTFSAQAVPTDVTCDDNGVYTLTLTASDAFNQVTTVTLHLNVLNVAPTLTITAPANGSSPRGVTFKALVTDPGSNDTQTCTINWGDGVTDTGVPVAGGVCTATHTYATSIAAATITATATDDDGGVSAPKSVSLTFNRPPVCLDVRSDIATLWPADHKLVLVTLSGATDPDGDAVTYAITGVRQDEALLGLGSGDTSPDAKLASGGSVWLRAERDGTGDGRVYTISFTVTDANGASCSGTTTVSAPHDQAHPAVKTPGVSVNSLG